MAKTSGRWVVYNRKDGEFIFLTKPLKTKDQAEKERVKLKARPEYSRAPIGVGFVQVLE